MEPGRLTVIAGIDEINFYTLLKAKGDICIQIYGIC